MWLQSLLLRAAMGYYIQKMTSTWTNLDEDKDDEDEYEYNNFSAVHPDDVVSRNCILGGPQRPDTSKMSKREEELELDNYKKKRKSYTDAKQMEMTK